LHAPVHPIIFRLDSVLIIRAFHFDKCQRDAIDQDRDVRAEFVLTIDAGKLGCYLPSVSFRMIEVNQRNAIVSFEQIIVELLTQIFCVQYLLEILKQSIDLNFGKRSAIQTADGITKCIDKDIGISVVSILFERNVLISQPRQVKKSWDLYALILRSAHPCHLCTIE